MLGNFRPSLPPAQKFPHSQISNLKGLAWMELLAIMKRKMIPWCLNSLANTFDWSITIKNHGERKLCRGRFPVFIRAKRTSWNFERRHNLVNDRGPREVMKIDADARFRWESRIKENIASIIFVPYVLRSPLSFLFRPFAKLEERRRSAHHPS